MNENTSLYLRVCPPSRGDDDYDGFTFLGMNVFPSSRVRAGRLLLVVSMATQGSLGHRYGGTENILLVPNSRASMEELTTPEFS